MHIFWLVLKIFGIIFGLYILLGVYLAVVLKWEDDQTVGLAYYGRPPADRDRFKRALRLHAVLLSPILSLNGRLAKLDFRKARIQHKGVSAPTGSCDLASFEKAEGYQPRPEDIFVVTQMKCGTTWMQHVVYEGLQRGTGDLVASGHGPLRRLPLARRTQECLPGPGAPGGYRTAVPDHQNPPAGPALPLESGRAGTCMWPGIRCPVSPVVSISWPPTWAAWRHRCPPTRSGSPPRT